MDRRLRAGTRPHVYVFILLVSGLPAACSSSHRAAPVPAEAILAEPDGPGVVADLRARYADTTSSCKGNEPAVRCTGILLEASRLRDPWLPYKPDGVPMSWFRIDGPMPSTYEPERGVQAGMIYYSPDRSVQFGKRPLNVQCAYVFNAFTNFRPNGRCEGIPASNTPESGPCQPQGIVDLDTWIAHIKRNPDPPQNGGWQCGFDLSATDRTAVFSHFPSMMKEALVNKYPGAGHDELIIYTWPQDGAQLVPIEAFFYNAGPDTRQNSLERAQALQKLMNDKAGIWRPVVEIRFPLDPTDEVLFGYNVGDQGIPAPASKPD
ncbi:hypothetical protein L2Y94_07255 [Luteibacter aegosomatis]|uniref:hypothetical protein n=1 Tax=Luteibacter aegosomatis TaxID=2911537 RepID=UPI001FFAD2D0|nr:hypothetical protein [Luteibacter aegosomatis]UPG87140.1 hypothetical protein L2Y94_07255 [Luteibacter aegosomatis]